MAQELEAFVRLTLLIRVLELNKDILEKILHDLPGDDRDLTPFQSALSENRSYYDSFLITARTLRNLSADWIMQNNGIQGFEQTPRPKKRKPGAEASCPG